MVANLFYFNTPCSVRTGEYEAKCVGGTSPLTLPYKADSVRSLYVFGILCPKGESFMRHYETIYIVNPNQSDEEYRQIKDRCVDLLEKKKSVVIKIQDWGKQRLAYNVQKFNYGSYVLVDFCADPGVTAELERNLKLDDRVLKYQTVKIADKADPEALLQQEEAKREIRAEEDKAVPENLVAPNDDSVTESEVDHGEK